MLKIKRLSKYGDRIRNYKIIVDGKPVGKIADGDTFEYNIPPGNHTIYLKIDYARSKKINFNVKGKKNIQFICYNNTGGLKSIFIMLYATILYARYIKLERVDKF